MVSSAVPKPVRLTYHAKRQMLLRGAEELEVVRAVREAKWQAAKRGKFHAKLGLPFGKPSPMNSVTYKFKVVDAVFADEPAEIVVVTVKVYYHD